MAPNREGKRRPLLPMVLSIPEQKTPSPELKAPTFPAGSSSLETGLSSSFRCLCISSNFEPIPKTAKNKDKEELELKGKFGVHVYFRVDGTAQPGGCPPSWHTENRLCPCSSPAEPLGFAHSMLCKEKTQRCALVGCRGTPASLTCTTDSFLHWGGAFFCCGVVLVLFSSLVTEVDAVAHSGLLWTMRQVPVRSQSKGRDAGRGGFRLKPMGKKEFLLL